MNALIRCAVLLLLAVPAFGQQQTLFSGTVEQGVYGAPTAKFTQIADDWGIMIGGRIEWIADHQFGVGIGAYALGPAQIYSSFLIEGKALTLRMTHVGAHFEYFIRPNDLVHATVDAFVGAGGLYYTITEGDQDKNPRPDNFGAEIFSMIEPGINLEMNLTSYLHFSIGGSYRLAFNVDYQDLKGSDLNGLSATAALRVGFF